MIIWPHFQHFPVLTNQSWAMALGEKSVWMEDLFINHVTEDKTCDYSEPQFPPPQHQDEQFCLIKLGWEWSETILGASDKCSANISFFFWITISIHAFPPLPALLSLVGSDCRFCLKKIFFLVLFLVFVLTSNWNINSLGTGTAFSLSFVNHNFTTSNYFDLCIWHINARLTGWTVTSEKRCSPEATGGAERGLNPRTGFSCFVHRRDVPIPEEEILISQVAQIFLCVVQKRQLFCFVLVDNLNIPWNVNPNSRNKIWIGI